MPQLRARNHNRVVSGLPGLYAGRAGSNGHGGAAPPVVCAAGVCGQPVVPDCPVPLCPRHLRQAWEFAQGVIEHQLLTAAASVIER